MDLFLTLGIPAIIVTVLLRLFKLKWPFALLIIFGLSALSTYTVNFIYCELLNTKCELDALNAVGYFFHWASVSFTASILDFSLYKLFFNKVE
jgi:hypothetical protein